MLKLRILTAIVLIAGVVLGILYAPLSIKAIILTVIGLAAGYEWLKLIEARAPIAVIFYGVLLACFSAIYFNLDWGMMALWLALPWWLLATLWVVAYQSGRRFWPKNIFVQTLIGLLLIVPMWAGLYLLFAINPPQEGAYLALFLLCIVWSSDIFAYFVGRAWGRHLLASRVSPGKTWQGAIGAFIGTGVVAYAGLTLFFADRLDVNAVFILSLGIVFVSIIGDLFESMVKRIQGVKDSGQLLPGHGGVLDRLDSLTAAAPLFAWVYLYFIAA